MNTAISSLLSFCFLEREHLSDLRCVTEVASQLSGSRASNYSSSCNRKRGNTSPKGNEEGQINIMKSKHNKIPPYFLSLRKNWFYSFSIFTQVSWFIPRKIFYNLPLQYTPSHSGSSFHQVENHNIFSGLQIRSLRVIVDSLIYYP